MGMAALGARCCFMVKVRRFVRGGARWISLKAYVLRYNPDVHQFMVAAFNTFVQTLSLEPVRRMRRVNVESVLFAMMRRMITLVEDGQYTPFIVEHFTSRVFAFLKRC